MSPMMLGYKEFGIEMLEPLQDHLHRPQWPPMEEEKKDDAVGDPIKLDDSAHTMHVKL